jgi:hypothetical protein
MYEKNSVHSVFLLKHAAALPNHISSSSSACDSASTHCHVHARQAPLRRLRECIGSSCCPIASCLGPKQASSRCASTVTLLTSRQGHPRHLRSESCKGTSNLCIHKYNKLLMVQNKKQKNLRQFFFADQHRTSRRELKIRSH